MQFDLSLVKKHPYATGAIVLVGAVILYAIMKGGSSGASSSGGYGASYDLQQAKLDAATNISESQIQAGVQTASIQAGTVNNQTAAQLEVARENIQASTVQQANAIAGGLALTALQGQISTTQQVNALTEQNFEVGTAAAVQTYTVQQEAETAQKVASLQAGAAEAATESQYQIAAMELNNQATIDAAVIKGASADKGRSSTGWTQIISALMGRGPEAIAANQPSAVANSPSAILNGIGKAAGGILGGIFG